MTDDLLRQEQLDEGIKACKQARYAEAEQLLKSSLAHAEHFGELDQRLASSLNELGVLYTKIGNYCEAEDCLNRALAIRRQSAGLLHASTGESLNDLAVLKVAQGDYDKAQELLTQALQIRRDALGADHQDVAETLNELGITLIALGKLDESESHIRLSLETREKSLGFHHVETAETLMTLAALYRHRGKYSEAEPLYKQALAIEEKSLGPDHVDTVTTLIALASFYLSQGNYAAEEIWERVLRLGTQVDGKQDNARATALRFLGLLRETQHKPTEAEQFYRQALDIFASDPACQEKTLVDTLKNYSSLLRTQKREVEAEQLDARRNRILAKQQVAIQFLPDQH